MSATFSNKLCVRWRAGAGCLLHMPAMAAVWPVGPGRTQPTAHTYGPIAISLWNKESGGRRVAVVCWANGVVPGGGRLSSRREQEHG